MATYLDAAQTFGYNSAGPTIPDCFFVKSKDGNAAAASLIVTRIVPGRLVQLQVIHSKEPKVAYQFFHTMTATDTLQSVAENFCAQVSANTALGGHKIAGQWVPGSAQIAVSHWFDDDLSLGVCAFNTDGTPVNEDWGGVMLFITNGGSRLDAGGQIALIRDPDGWIPQAGSNIGQFLVEARTLAGVLAQYGTLCVNIIDPDPAHPRGEWEFDTIGLVDGQVSIKARVFIGEGIYACVDGVKLADMGEGSINMNDYYRRGRPIIVRADGSLALG